MKTITIEGLGEVTIRKSAKAKRLILKINHSGKSIVVIPRYVAYALGERFARKNSEWFLKHAPTLKDMQLSDGKRIGVNYILTFLPAEKPVIKSRVGRNTITVSHPEILTAQHKDVQNEALKACKRALKKDAEFYLPKKLHALAQKYGYSYNQVRIKTAQTRWGSCSSKRIINLSVWLLQLPDELVEYVLCHELAHLKHMNHQKAFWDEVATMVPDYKNRRQAIKQYNPQLL